MPAPAKPLPSFRRDGWSPARQLRFLDMLALTRSVTRAAAAAGMSRESAYRLRARHPDGLFAAAWARALESHKSVNPRAPRPAAQASDLPWFSIEGHEMDEALFSCAAGSTS